MAPELKQFGRVTLASFLGSAISIAGFIFWVGSFTATTKAQLSDHEKRITNVELNGSSIGGKVYQLLDGQAQLIQWQKDHEKKWGN